MRRDRRKKAREAARASAPAPVEPPSREAPAPDAPAARAATADALAGFALLADPSTIAGEAAAPRPLAATTNDEVERLRAALHMRSQEIEALQQRWQAPEAEAAHVHESGAAPADSAPPQRTLLDAASARRLAADARKRERASRAALAEAQKALGVVRDEPTAKENEPTAGERIQPEREPTAHEARTSDGGWRQRPLVARASEDDRSTVGPGAPEADGSATRAHAIAERPDTDPTATAIEADETIRALARKLRVARAEVREHASTLALARERTRGLQDEVRAKREEIAELRELLGQRDAAIAERDAQPNGRVATAQPSERATPSDETRRLEARVASLETELTARDAERARFEAALSERDAFDATRRDQLDALHDRLEAQDRALDAARREYELERGRHSRSLELITRLRATLTNDVAGADSLVDAQPEPTAAPTAVVHADGPQSSGPTSTIAEPPATDAAIQPDDQAAAAARVAAYWLDDQVRRHFGPMGIDRFADLLTAPLARRRETLARPATVLLVGRGVRHLAPGLAEALVAGGPDRCEVHFADTACATTDADLATEDPLADLLVRASAPVDPSTLDDLVHAVRPDVIVCHALLSHEADPAPWIDVLEAAAGRRIALLLSEATGSPIAAAPEEVATIGDRIWSLMPDRYTRMPDGARCESWRAAWAACPDRPANGLATALRARFRPELFAQFGFLAEPFLRAGIAGNFDVTAERDRRFLAQVSDLDERRIEAGDAPALHTIALIDGLAEG